MDDDLTRFTDSRWDQWHVTDDPAGVFILHRDGADPQKRSAVVVPLDDAPRLVAAILTAYNRAKGNVPPGEKGGPDA